MQNNESLTIVDVKYKPKLYPGDLYQIGFYIHEYTKKRENLTGNHAFAVLPQYPDNFKKPHTFEATETKITVFERHLDLDKCMSLILNKDESKIKKLVKRILDPKDNLENLYS